MTVWFDVEDLITHFQQSSRPTGIQRVTFEIYREVWKAAGAAGQVRFCRHGPTPAEYILVDWPELEAGILAANATAAADETARQTAKPAPAARKIMAKIQLYLYPRITPTVRNPLSAIFRSQKSALLAVPELVRALLAAAGPGAPAKIGALTLRLSRRRAEFAPQDVFVTLGGSWGQLNAAAGRQVQMQYGMRFAVLIHDLIPALYPEWTSPESVPKYRVWLRDVVPHADKIFAVSRHTAGDLLRLMAESDKPVATPVVLPIGHRRPRPEAPENATGNPFDRPFVLFVSTIEVRKNHALLFRVWRRLLDSLPAAAVPYLVFAGKTGWLTADFMAQLQNAGWLNGHIKWIESPTDPELTALYQACAFTVFPSLYEGWGLPVTESLSFGKAVAASNRSAIPEAGGDFCRYFDPENVEDAYRVIRDMIENPEQIRQLERRIAESFRPPDWADTAAVLLAQLQPEDHPAGPAGSDSGKIRVVA